MDATITLAACAVAASSSAGAAALARIGLCQCCIADGEPCEQCVDRAAGKLIPVRPERWRHHRQKWRHERRFRRQYIEWCLPTSLPETWPLEWWTRERVLEHQERLGRALREQDQAVHAGLLETISTAGLVDTERRRFDAFFGITQHDLCMCTSPHAAGIAYANQDFEEAHRLRLLAWRTPPFRCIACKAWLAGADVRVHEARAALETRRSLCDSFCTEHAELRWECKRYTEQLVLEAVQLRFAGDGDRRRAWLEERERERELFEAHEAADKEAKAAEKAANDALRAAAFELKREADTRRDEAMATLEAARLGAIEHTALARGKIPITVLNAGEYPPPPFSDERNGALGVAMGAPQVWFWQMTGRRCVARSIKSHPYWSFADDQYEFWIRRWEKMRKKGATHQSGK